MRIFLNLVCLASLLAVSACNTSSLLKSTETKAPTPPLSNEVVTFNLETSLQKIKGLSQITTVDIA